MPALPAALTSPDLALEQTIALTRKLAAQKFWGTLTIRYESGVPIHLQKAESILPTKLGSTPKELTYNDESFLSH